MAENVRDLPYRIRTEAGYTAMVDFETVQGDRQALPYSYLVSINYNPSEGLVLTFASHVVRIRGRNLDDLYLALVRQRAEYIRAEDAHFDTRPESEPFIEKIDITPNE